MSDEVNDGGFAAHMSSTWHETSAAPSNKAPSVKKSCSREEIDYDNPFPTRPPAMMPTEAPITASNHPFLQQGSASLQSSRGRDDVQSSVSHDQIEMLPATGAEFNTNSNNIVTLTGTIKRGKKDAVEVVQLQLTPEQLEKMNRSTITIDDTDDAKKCGMRKGPHIVLMTLLFVPFAFLSSFCVCFYVGTMCWYNIYLYLSEEKSVVHKIFLCPLLILFYPVLIILLSLGLGLYSAGVQISWYLSSWLRQIRDFDKGFFGWLCQKLHVPQCAPYEVVILDDNAFGQAGLTGPQAESV